MFVLRIFFMISCQKKNRSLQKRHQFADLCAQDLTITDASPIFTDIYVALLKPRVGLELEVFGDVFYSLPRVVGSRNLAGVKSGQPTTRAFYDIFLTVGQTPAGVFQVRE